MKETGLIGMLLCKLGSHRWVPESWFTCNNNDKAMLCRRCFKYARDV